MAQSAVTTPAFPSTTELNAVPVRPRLDSVDLWRGTIMAFMLLDHTRDFIMNNSIGPTDMATTTPALFFTRWITHFCAPGFMLLAGLGAALAMGRGKTRSEMSWFLFTRGLWIIALEFTLGRWGISFNLTYSFVWMLVLWSLGCAMVAMSAMIYLPRKVLAVVTVVAIAGHNLFDGINAAALGSWSWLWVLLHQPGVLKPANPTIFDGYPWIPWIFVMSAGFLLGEWYKEAGETRRRKLIYAGSVMTAGFVLLRLVNGYGDPSHWQHQSSAIMTLCSFLNTSKQPPSLLFLLMTLGPTLIMLALLERPLPKWTKPLITFGRVPLFFYLLNFPVPHVLSIGLSIVTGQDWKHFETPLGPFMESPAGFGHSLGMTYAVWITGLLILYPLCAWYAGVKARSRSKWLSYL
ncbi:MAG TPA: heparan-alpha-glucosaminide N-acetyltransferase domain-containing protein [Terriglobales bacterium]|nr:heparan-alpha-glucosaminide N-acetyltransferase domain-containing protein [Terriglobales bacterium]